MSYKQKIDSGVQEAIESGNTIVQTLKSFKKFFLSVLTITIAGMILFPLIMVFNMALKTSHEFWADPIGLTSDLNWENLGIAWTDGNFSTYVTNSVIVVGTSLFLLIVVSSLAAYALVEFDIPYKTLLLLGIIAGFMVPPEAIIVPLFMGMDAIGWINQYQSVILVYVATGIPFAAFFLRQYFVTIPGSLSEAARLDGCSEWQVFTRVYLPMSIPALTTVFVFQFILFWNEFLYAIVFLTRDSVRTAPAGLLAFQVGHETDYTLLAAAVLIAAIPAVIVFLLFRNYFIRGFTMGRV